MNNNSFGWVGFLSPTSTAFGAIQHFGRDPPNPEFTLNASAGNINGPFFVFVEGFCDVERLQSVGFSLLMVKNKALKCSLISLLMSLVFHSSVAAFYHWENVTLNPTICHVLLRAKISPFVFFTFLINGLKADHLLHPTGQHLFSY